MKSHRVILAILSLLLPCCTANDAPPRASSTALTTLSATPLSLSPAFSPDIHDYAVRCAAGANALSLSWTAAAGARATLATTTTEESSTPDGGAPAPSPEGGPLPYGVESWADAGQDVTAVRGALTGSSTDTLSVQLDEGQLAVLDVDVGSGSSEYWIRCLPHDFPPIDVTQNAVTGGPSDGFYLVGTAAAGAGDGYFAMVLDAHGTPVWYQRAAKPVFNVDLVAPNVVSYTANAVPAGFGTDPNAVYELHDLAHGDTTTVRAVDGPTDIHEFHTLASGHYVVLSNPLVDGVDLTGLQSFGPNSTIDDCVIQELDASGAVVWTWRASDHVDIVRESTYPQTPVIDGETVVDAFHCNSIDESSTGDLLVSARHLDAVFLISKATGAIVWKLGGAAYSRDGAELLRLAGDPGFFRQHDARFLSADSISLFDDETAMTAPARAVAYSLDLARGTATWLWQRPGSAPSAAMGSARLATDGHLLVGWGVLVNAHTAFTEFDGAGHDVFDVSFPAGETTYRAVKASPASFDLDVLRRAVE